MRSKPALPIDREFKSWLEKSSSGAPISTNQGGATVPFQRWFKFKEAFAPQLVLDAMNLDSGEKIERCLDPFGGCGTTGLTCQFAGIHPVLIEVNPFIADLAEAKLSTYDLDALTDDYLSVRAQTPNESLPRPSLLKGAPVTLCEPGDGKRWVFPKDVAKAILQYRVVIERLHNPANRRLLRVILGSLIVNVSNVTVNGKGRKYRGGWESQQRSAGDVHAAFEAAFLTALQDITRYASRAATSYELRRGTCLAQLDCVEPCDLAVLSPPYPNSFDYTDVYNLELWMLGYLTSRDDNKALRESTMRSHVQNVGRYTYSLAPSKLLHETVEDLTDCRARLWDDRIPDMVGAYFEDMQRLLTGLRRALRPGGRAVIVIGESSYAGIRVRSGHIAAQIAKAGGFSVRRHLKLRTMRLSAQQGGNHQLEERLLELQT